MTRYCIVQQVRPERLDEYRERHGHVWPELLRALAAAGWRKYSLFLREDGLLIGYVEADDLVSAQQAVAATEVNARWQAEMAPFFGEVQGRPDEGFRLVPEVFDLGDQLARTGANDPESGCDPAPQVPTSEPLTGKSLS